MQSLQMPLTGRSPRLGGGEPSLAWARRARSGDDKREGETPELGGDGSAAGGATEDLGTSAGSREGRARGPAAVAATEGAARMAEICSEEAPGRPKRGAVDTARGVHAFTGSPGSRAVRSVCASPRGSVQLAMASECASPEGPDSTADSGARGADESEPTSGAFGRRTSGASDGRTWKKEKVGGTEEERLFPQGEGGGLGAERGRGGAATEGGRGYASRTEPST